MPYISDKQLQSLRTTLIRSQRFASDYESNELQDMLPGKSGLIFALSEAIAELDDLSTIRQENISVFVLIKGGCFESAYSEKVGLNVTLIDVDTQGCDEEDIQEVTFANGATCRAYIQHTLEMPAKKPIFNCSPRASEVDLRASLPTARTAAVIPKPEKYAAKRYLAPHPKNADLHILVNELSDPMFSTDRDFRTMLRKSHLSTIMKTETQAKAYQKLCRLAEISPDEDGHTLRFDWTSTINDDESIVLKCGGTLDGLDLLCVLIRMTHEDCLPISIPWINYTEGEIDVVEAGFALISEGDIDNYEFNDLIDDKIQDIHHLGGSSGRFATLLDEQDD